MGCAMALWSSCIWSFYTASNPFVASYPGLVAVVYWQRDINQADYRAGLVLIPKSQKCLIHSVTWGTPTRRRASEVFPQALGINCSWQ